MIEARLVKTRILGDGIGGTLLVGVAEYEDEALNFKVPYEWEEVNESPEAFSLAIRDKIAEEFDIPINYVDMRDDNFIKEMRTFDMMNKGIIV